MLKSLCVGIAKVHKKGFITAFIKLSKIFQHTPVMPGMSISTMAMTIGTISQITIMRCACEDSDVSV